MNVLVKNIISTKITTGLFDCYNMAVLQLHVHSLNFRATGLCYATSQTAELPDKIKDENKRRHVLTVLPQISKMT